MNNLSTAFKTYNQPIILNHYTNTDHISKKIINGKNFYEYGMLNYIYNNISRKGTFIDVGANIGNHTVFFSKFCAEKVISVEPVNENLQLLEKNVSTNQLKNVRIIPYGLGKASTTKEVVRFNTNMGSCMLEVNPNPNELINNKKKVLTGDQVKVVTPQEMALDEITDLTLVKIDCENMSMEVLESLKEIIIKNKAHLFIEATPQEVKTIEKILNYRVVRQFNATPTFHFKTK